MPALTPLPPQPADVPWPTGEWEDTEPPPGVDGEALQKLLDATFAEPQPPTTVQTNDLLIVHRGRIVAERYAQGVGPDDVQPSWSMAKSILQAAVGVLVRDGKLDIAAPAAVPEWQEPGDARAQITLDSLLHMTSGLRFAEDYVDAGVSDVIEMLFQPGADDTAAFAAAFPQDHPPDTVFNYSSGTSNIISGIVKRIVGAGDEYVEFLRRELFDRIGMTTATPTCDNSGAWVASSYCFATPRDFARFGLLYMRDGVWDGQRILPEGWVDYARTPAPRQPAEDERGYGAHWWLWEDGLGTFLAGGYVGQMIYVVPALDLILVRNGNTPVERRLHMVRLHRQIIDLFRSA
ncbi:MAG: serine hydrolase [Chloroflexi bacterium]|nr:serine hydrolase [Chloroflexota bacterium]